MDIEKVKSTSYSNLHLFSSAFICFLFLSFFVPFCLVHILGCPPRAHKGRLTGLLVTLIPIVSIFSMKPSLLLLALLRLVLLPPAMVGCCFALSYHFFDVLTRTQ